MIIQNKLSNDLETCRKLITLFHPKCPYIDDKQLSNMCRNGNYHWVEIVGNVKDYGKIDLIISNKDDTSNLIGGGHTIKGFEKRQHQLQFSIWRSTLDVNYVSSNYSVFDHTINEFTDNESYILRPKYTSILKESEYETMTSTEWMDEYYSN